MKPGERSELVIIKAVNPKSVVCAESILVNVLTSLGVPLHEQPGMDFADFRETLPDGSVKRTLRWTLLAATRDGKYRTRQLIDWWNDPKWLAANPAHELTIHRTAHVNMLKLAERIRSTPHTDVYRKGRHQLLVPSHLSRAKKEEAIARLAAAA